MPAFGKIIAGGFPIGVTSGRAEVMEVFDPGTRGARRITTGGMLSASPVTIIGGWRRCGR